MSDEYLIGAIELARGLCAVLGGGILHVGIEHPDCMCRVAYTTNVRHQDSVAIIDGNVVQMRLHVNGRKALVWIGDQDEPTVITTRSRLQQCGPQS